MIFYVDFAVKIGSVFNTIHSVLIEAISVSECQHKAEKIKESLYQNKNNEVYIFIEEGGC